MCLTHPLLLWLFLAKVGSGGLRSGSRPRRGAPTPPGPDAQTAGPWPSLPQPSFPSWREDV